MNLRFKSILWYLFQCVTVPFTMAVARYSIEGNNVFVALMLSNIFSLLLILPFVAKAGRKALASERHMLLFIRTACGLAGVLLLFHGVTKVPLNEAQAVAFINPVLTTVAAVFILKEKLYRHRVVGLVVGFTGVLVALRPDIGEFNYNVFYIIAAIVFIAIIQVLIRILNRTETPFKLLFYMMFYSALLNIPLGVYFWEPPSPENLFWIALLGVMAFVNVYPLIIALKHADISTLMPLDFTKLIFTALFAWFLFNEDLKLWTVIGSVIILSGVYYVVRRERRLRMLAPALG